MASLFILSKDVAHVLERGMIKLGYQHFCISMPQEGAWELSTLEIKGIPANKSQDEILLNFENKRMWRKTLEVKHIVRDQNVTYIIFNKQEGMYVF